MRSRPESLASIIDPNASGCGGFGGACIDPIFGPTQRDIYWSSSTADSSDSGNAWVVYFGDTSVARGGKAGGFYARAVRGGS